MDEFLKNSEWYKTLWKYEHILVFGTRDNSRTVYKRILRCGKDIECFLVSDEHKAGKPAMMSGKPIKAVSEIIKREWKENGLVVITNNYANNIRNILQKAGFQNFVLGAPTYTQLTTDELKKYCNIILEPANLGHIESVSDYCSQNAAADSNTRNICVYVVTSHANFHQAKRKINSKYSKYIQAGSACTEQQICDIRDDTGDNISIQNPLFNEVTAGYWIYKNDTIHDYVGLYHYSRELAMTDQQIEAVTAAGVDMVLPVPTIINYPPVFLTTMPILLEVIEQISPEYLQAAEDYFTSHMFFTGNVIFAKKEIFDHYYAWLFKIFSGISAEREKRRLTATPRMYAYYAEHLSNIYFLHHAKDRFTLYTEMNFLF